MNELAGKYLFLTNLAATLFMTGVIWFVQIVHYPLFAYAGTERYGAYHIAHQTLTTYIVMPPMLLEMVTAWLLLFVRTSYVTHWQAGFGLALVISIWLATFFVSVPLHNALNADFDAHLHQQLVRTNWIRTIAWSLRGAFLLYLTVRAIR